MNKDEKPTSLSSTLCTTKLEKQKQADTSAELEPKIKVENVEIDKEVLNQVNPVRRSTRKRKVVVQSEPEDDDDEVNNYIDFDEWKIPQETDDKLNSDVDEDYKRSSSPPPENKANRKQRKSKILKNNNKSRNHPCTNCKSSYKSVFDLEVHTRKVHLGESIRGQSQRS